MIWLYGFASLFLRVVTLGSICVHLKYEWESSDGTYSRTVEFDGTGWLWKCKRCR